MSAPLSKEERKRGLDVLRAVEGPEWMFPVGRTWEQERARIDAATKNLNAAFGRPCRLVKHVPSSEDTGYEYTSYSGTIMTRPRRGRGVRLLILVCTFGIATAWPSKWKPNLGMSLFHSQEWVPWWWDTADERVERSLAKASDCLADAGYTYVPDPILDEPYDSSYPFWESQRERVIWFERYFGAQRTALRRPDGGASIPLRDALAESLAEPLGRVSGTSLATIRGCWCLIRVGTAVAHGRAGGRRFAYARRRRTCQGRSEHREHHQLTAR